MALYSHHTNKHQQTFMSHTSCFTHYAFLTILLFTIVFRCSSIGSRRWGGTAGGTFSAAERTRAAVSAAREGGRLPPGSRSHRPRSQCGTSACWARWTRIRPPWSWCPSLAWVPGQMSQSHWSAANTVSGQFKSLSSAQCQRTEYAVGWDWYWLG